MATYNDLDPLVKEELDPIHDLVVRIRERESHVEQQQNELAQLSPYQVEERKEKEHIISLLENDLENWCNQRDEMLEEIRQRRQSLQLIWELVLDYINR